MAEHTVLAVTKQCPMCRGNGEVELPRRGFFRWRDGMLIQDALPGLPVELREQLISGLHPACQDELYGAFDDEDDDEEVG